MSPPILIYSSYKSETIIFLPGWLEGNLFFNVRAASKNNLFIVYSDGLYISDYLNSFSDGLYTSDFLS